MLLGIILPYAKFGLHPKTFSLQKMGRKSLVKLVLKG